MKASVVINNRVLLGIPEVSLSFDMNNEPAYKYSVINFCDRSDDPKEWMSYKLKS